MKDLADRLGVGVQAVSTLELNDDRGTIKMDTRRRALLALGKREIPVVIDAVSDADAESIEASARKLVERTAWSMALSGRRLNDEAVERLVKRVVRKRSAA